MISVTLCVDALEPRPGGIGRYTWELCKGLADDRRVSPLLFFGRNQMLPDPAFLLQADAVPRPLAKWRRWWGHRAMRSSVVHGPNYFLPPFVERGVITVHDLSVFRFPETHPVQRVKAFEREFASSLSRASHVITDTETVRREVIEMFSFPAESITAISLGVDAVFRPQPADALAEALSRWGLKAAHYGLCVSTLEPRKRISELLAAWRALPPRIRDCYPLVLCGGSGWRNDDLRENVDVGVSEGWLRHLGFVEESLLPQLYAGAALFIYPSIYEGFGLPPLEAMAAGVPVMVSHRSCMPEVCAEAARYFDPDDVVGLTAKISASLTDREWRAGAVKRGMKRASEFSWAKCVDQTIGVYSRLG